MICDHHGYTRCDRLSAPPWLLSDGGIVPRVHGLERFSNEGGEGGGDSFKFGMPVGGRILKLLQQLWQHC